MMKNHSDKRFQNVDALWCHRPTLWTRWWDYTSLYPLPLENYRVCFWKGPITDTKTAGALLQSESKQLLTFTASDLKLLNIQPETFPPLLAWSPHTCRYRYRLLLTCIWPLSGENKAEQQLKCQNYWTRMQMDQNSFYHSTWLKNLEKWDSVASWYLGSLHGILFITRVCFHTAFGWLPPHASAQVTLH